MYFELQAIALDVVSLCKSHKALTEIRAMCDLPNTGQRGGGNQNCAMQSMTWRSDPLSTWPSFQMQRSSGSSVSGITIS